MLGTLKCLVTFNRKMLKLNNLKNHFGGDEKKHSNLEASCSFKKKTPWSFGNWNLMFMGMWYTNLTYRGISFKSPGGFRRVLHPPWRLTWLAGKSPFFNRRQPSSNAWSSSQSCSEFPGCKISQDRHVFEDPLHPSGSGTDRAGFRGA